MWIHSVVLEIPVINGKANIPQTTSLFFAESRKLEKSIIIKTTNNTILGDDGSTQRTKIAFNSHFKCQMKNDRRFQIFFVLHCLRPLYKVKQDCYVFLSNNRLWLQKSLGPIQSTVMLAIRMYYQCPSRSKFT